ncbi:hypothetical protein CJD36_003110 [Flavipsychrobacter stenotrophus]|uniref:Uncharacterized protein n=1 Tax=Flavipsychrobacter stenotrophus TaxID=2077091 RepID=A0A2S7T0N5_9BACT|nr:hypothetical protein [Flavipsychrobacter stenotrophus]PQJ12752.1 hypothetical protein CJD36_003110 [Flavipsychrobacter stenotrophus]
MIEIIVLIFLSRNIGYLAQDKGLKPGLWKFYVVLAWILTEFSVAVVGGMLQLEIVPILLIAYPLAFVSYLILKTMLKRMPDKDEWINDIGSSNEGI